MNSQTFTVRLPENESIRVDKFVSSLGLFSRSQIARRSVVIKSSSGEPLKLSRHLKNNDSVVVEWDDLPEIDILPEQTELNIIYEDNNVIVLDKAQGMVVHPAHGNYHGTLVQGLLYYLNGLDENFNGDKLRPGIVHRLDKDTSGLIITAKNPETLEFLSGQFKNRKVKKIYLAVTKGIPSPYSSEINIPIGRSRRDRKKFSVNTVNAKDALTRYEVIAVSGNYALVKLRILTGRTHQIRVHMQHSGTPVLGDPLYSRKDNNFPDVSLMLHSWKLSLEIPGVGKKRFVSDIPDRFKKILTELDIDFPEKH